MALTFPDTQPTVPGPHTCLAIGPLFIYLRVPASIQETLLYSELELILRSCIQSNLPEAFLSNLSQCLGRWITTLASLNLIVAERPIFSKTEITKYCKGGSLHGRDLFSHSSGSWKTKIKVLADILGLQMSAFSLCPYMFLSLCGHIPGLSLCIQISVLIRTLVVSDYGPPYQKYWP